MLHCITWSRDDQMQTEEGQSAENLDCHGETGVGMEVYEQSVDVVCVPGEEPDVQGGQCSVAESVSDEALEAAFGTDSDEHEGDSGPDGETEDDKPCDCFEEPADEPEGEVKTSARWKDDIPASTSDEVKFVCPHPKCPSHKKPNARLFKKRKERPVQEPERKTEWGRYLFQFKKDHPEMDKYTAKVEARKTYTPKNGKKKSFHRIFAEKWKANNPLWTQIKDPEALERTIRTAFLAQV